MRFVKSAAIWILSASTASAQAPAAHVRYEIPLLPGFEQSFVTAISEVGHAVGYATSHTGEVHPFIWTAEGGTVDLGTRGGRRSFAYDVNDLGEVVGYNELPDGGSRAFLWTTARGMVDLGTLGGRYSAAFAINDSGQIAGTAQTASPIADHAVIWTRSGGVIDLGAPGGRSSAALGINEVGEVTGTIELGPDAENEFSSKVFVWTPGVGFQLTSATGLGNDINERQQVTGGPVEGFLWSAKDGLKKLGTFGARSEGFAVNNRREVVGWSAFTDGGIAQAFLWTASGGLMPLASAPSSAQGINDSGWVVTSNALSNPIIWQLDVTPGDLVAALRARVSAFERVGVLGSRDSDDLAKRLDQAERRLDGRSTAAFAAALRTFAKRLDRLVREGTLTAPQAVPLHHLTTVALDLAQR